MLRAIGFWMFLGLPLYAVILPKGLSPTEFDRVVEIVGQGGASRLMRSAEAFPVWPGLKLGMELVLIPTKNINELGDGSGSFPTTLPMPRLHITKGLVGGLELGFNFFTDTMFNSLASVGGTVKWTFLKEQDDDQWLSAAAYAGYTNLRGFGSQYFGDDFEVGAMVSKDYVRLRPYAGGGVLLARGELNPALSPQKNDGMLPTLHSFVGIEVDAVVNFGIQIDLMNLSPMASTFFGVKI